MPELPEVETVVRSLHRTIVGKTIKSVVVLWPKLARPSSAILSLRAKNKKVIKVRRRAKLIIIALASGDFLVVHLKMTGQLIYQSVAGQLSGGGHPIKDLDSVPNRFTYITFTFQDGSHLYFNDVRKFGYIKVVSASELKKIEAEYGPEPLIDLSSDHLVAARLRRPKAKIKQLIMDQSVVAGVGNIYADEALFAAGILPSHPLGKLSNSQLKKLILEIKKVLQKSILQGGTSFNTFRSAGGEVGQFRAKLKVYGRGGQACLKCKTKLKTARVGGRGTVYCPKCQK
ncbi:MAG: bifunctional DNA-formamidopyrimidine glycosylase/DNA-(apurinic or apyrimidinic site) lyase [Candidatus Komeilibacteria bacterium]|nr:bifunctional DNA-formamidopyrimidine glycosylase/DNA-(apurinic or apyrimidinic site) lyase [Candidatus Komeilibacteria bacterium]